MELTAVFESWHIGDGNYPPLSKHQLVRLSFELQPTLLVAATLSSETTLRHIGDARYSGQGEVVYHYREGGDDILVVQAESFRFFVASPEVNLGAGARIAFEGTLTLDTYLWVEFLDQYVDPPDLFYTLKVARIRKVLVPERFISRQGTAMSWPASVPPDDFGAVVELDTMEGQPFHTEFYILDFVQAPDADVPRTFLGTPLGK